MKNIGLIGGMSWESSIEYYRIINQQVREALGGVHSARSVMVSVDFGEIEKLQAAGDWEAATRIMVQCAQEVEGAGADFILICTNTMHLMAEEVQEAIEIPLLHIADATAEHLTEKGIKTVGLLGTSFTMEHDFYKGRLVEKYGLHVLVPDKKDRAIVHNVIYKELCMGTIIESSKKEYLRIIKSLSGQGAEAVILGCTEIGMLVTPHDTDITLCDTAEVHAAKAVEYAIQQSAIYE